MYPRKLPGRPVEVTTPDDLYGFRIIDGDNVIDCPLPNTDENRYDELTPFPVAHVAWGKYTIMYLTPGVDDLTDIQFVQYDGAGQWVDGWMDGWMFHERGVNDTIEAFHNLVGTSKGFNAKTGAYVVESVLTNRQGELRTIQAACTARYLGKMTDEDLVDLVEGILKTQESGASESVVRDHGSQVHLGWALRTGLIQPSMFRRLISLTGRSVIS